MFDFNVNVMNKSINNYSLTEMTIHLDWNIFQSRRSGQLQSSRDSLSCLTTHQQRKQTPRPLDSSWNWKTTCLLTTPPCCFRGVATKRQSVMTHRWASASFSRRYLSASAGFFTLASSSISLRVISCSCSMICCARSTTCTCIFSSSIRCFVFAT